MAVRVVAVLGLCVVAGWLVGCSSETMPPPTPVVVQPHTVADTEVGTQVTCAVDQMEVTVAKITPAVNYEGKTYYFCNAADMDKFKADPTKYAVKAPVPKSTETP